MEYTCPLHHKEFRQFFVVKQPNFIGKDPKLKTQMFSLPTPILTHDMPRMTYIYKLTFIPF